MFNFFGLIILILLASFMHAKPQDNKHDPAPGACIHSEEYHRLTNGEVKTLEFNKKWVNCGRSALAYANGTTSCLHKEFPNIDEKCTRCFGNYTSCAARFSNCFSKCFRSASKECKICSLEKCGDDWARCTGLLKESVPQ